MKLSIAILLFILVFSKNVFAVTTTISNLPSTISTDPFTINIVISGASTGTNYLRIDLYKISSSNYFGETFNGSSWYNAGDYIQYYPVTIQSGNNWTGQVQGRLGSPSLTQYDGPGQYKIKVRRYTSSGSYSTTEANNGALDIIINVPIPTPTPVITPTDIIMPTPTLIPTITITPTLTPMLIITPTTTAMGGTGNPSPTETQTPIYTPTPQSYENIYISEAMVNPATGEKEWIEIFNDNDFPVLLNNWFIDDLENAGSSPKIFSLEINAKGYGIFDLISSMFNNDGDSIRLLDFNKNLKDDFEYQKTEQGKTLGRISFDSDVFCLQEPSKNSSNNLCVNPTPIPITSTPTGEKNLSSTIKNIPPGVPITKANNFDVSIHRSINYPTGVINVDDNLGHILGISNQLIKGSINNKSFINLLCFLSVLYSLLTISSILFRMKLSYGKNKNFYSSSLHSS